MRLRFGRVVLVILFCTSLAFTCGVGPVLRELIQRVDRIEEQMLDSAIEHGFVALDLGDSVPTKPNELREDVCFSETFLEVPTIVVSLRDASLPGQTLHGLTVFASTPGTGCFTVVLALPFPYQGGQALVSWLAVGRTE